ncbi:hypothetical protein Sste5346_009669 [Sporothrix stenoceras]|uniref:Xylanolytic transcriptional activator regulatory domain-containing protein n=1 Tax=Sporothrix stenoceras TaxID=5173 RepID=A0ABR3YK87_9PEZI
MEPRYLGSSSAFAFSRAIGSSFLLRDASKGGSSSKGEGTNATTDDPGTQSPINVPTYEDGLVLTNAYFENIHIQYPFLHEPTFRMWEVQRVSTLPVPVSDPDVASFFVYIIYAIGALLMPTSRYNHEQLYMLAMRYLDAVLQKDNLQSVQALLACCIYSLRSPTGPSLWKLTGFALRQCIELGYHRNVKSFGPQMGAVQVELRKRAFWTAFAIDCSVAMFLGRPLGVSIWEIDVELPKNIGDGNVFATATNNNSGVAPPAPDLSVALHMFRLRRLWAKVHVALFTDTTRIRTTDEEYTARIRQFQVELDEWRATAPPEPPRTGEALTLFGSNDWYNSNYSHSVLLLHRNQLIEARSAVPAPIVIACLEATECISRGYYRQFILGHVGCTWGCLHVLFLAGLTYLHCLWTSAAARAARPLNSVTNTCMDCSMVFAVMAERWDRAAAYRDMFETLSRKTMAMLVEVGVSDSEPSMSAWPGSVAGASTIVAESGSLEDPWEVMQWINEDLLQPGEDPGTFSI